MILGALLSVNTAIFEQAKDSKTCRSNLIVNCAPLYYLAFSAVFTNLDDIGKNGPTTFGSHCIGQDHDGQLHCPAVFNDGLCLVVMEQKQ